MDTVELYCESDIIYKDLYLFSYRFVLGIKVISEFWTVYEECL